MSASTREEKAAVAEYIGEHKAAVAEYIGDCRVRVPPRGNQKTRRKSCGRNLCDVIWNMVEGVIDKQLKSN